MLLYSIVSNILSMASLVGLTVAGCEMFCGVSLRSAPVAVGLPVKLNMTAGEWVSIVSGGSIEKRELLNEELEGEMGDGARSNSWEKQEMEIDQIHDFLIYLYLLCRSPGHGLFYL